MAEKTIVVDDERKGFFAGIGRWDPYVPGRFYCLGNSYLGVTGEQIDQLYGVAAIPEVAKAYGEFITLFAAHARKLGIEASNPTSPPSTPSKK